MKTTCLFLMLLLAGQVFAKCEGPEFENIQFTESEYQMYQEIQEQESLLNSIATLVNWSPLLVLAGGKWPDVAFSITTTSWDELATANKNLLRLRIKIAGEVMVFMEMKNPKNRQFWQALVDYYICIAQ